jgi:23S rRNA-/tRNA-specific pseudouridylate synthase
MEIFISFSKTMDDLFRELLHPKVRVIYSDINNVTALYKPCDVLSMPNKDHRISPKSLLRLPYNSKRRCYIFSSGREFFLLNRLDVPTSGLLIGCFDEEIAHAIRRCFFNQVVQKIYYALTAHQKIPPGGVFQDCLTERRNDRHLRVMRGRGEEAVAKYFVEKELDIGGIPLLKLRLQPITGRTHQLRVQCALRKLPIIGDKTYGDFALNKKLWPLLPQRRLYLQSCAVILRYDFHGKEYFFSTEIACEF